MVVEVVPPGWEGRLVDYLYCSDEYSLVSDVYLVRTNTFSLLFYGWIFGLFGSEFEEIGFNKNEGVLDEHAIKGCCGGGL